jgi:predicted transposase/invertase (TIGR01784 family)
VPDRLRVKNDYIFQQIFGRNENKAVSIDFLNAVLNLQADRQLTDLEIFENTRLQKEYPDDKLGILDIKARTNTGELINIEIQLINRYNMDQRTLFYWAKLFAGQLKEGQRYQNLKKTITINILDFNFIQIEAYHTVFHICEDHHKQYQLTEMLEIHFVELPKFRKSEGNPRDHLEGWLFFIEESPKEMLEMAIQANPAIRSAEELLHRLGSLDEVRRYYEAREKAIHDEISQITGAREEGKIEGKIEEKLETASKMLAKGLPEDLIIEMTGLTSKEIAKLKEAPSHTD